jgi:hypothetical protein
MHNRPILIEPGLEPEVERPASRKDAGKIETFLVSGGSNYFFDFTEWGTSARTDGRQLVASVYIPKGYTGFLKQLRVAPFKPAVLNPRFLIGGGESLIAWWIGFNYPGFSSNDEPERPDGVWETPFGWESYWNNTDEGALQIPPQWHWSLRVIQGNIADLRVHGNNLPPFNQANPAVLSDWYLYPDIPVPSGVYPSGLPGSSPGLQFERQRMQVIQADELSLNLVVKEDSTLALFTEWTQCVNKNGIVVPFIPILGYTGNNLWQYNSDNQTYPLLPSFGQLLGYMQEQATEASSDNLKHGWGG